LIGRESEIRARLAEIEPRLKLVTDEETRVGFSLWDNGKIPSNRSVQSALEARLRTLY
jgi:hypothetical protein